ncbi:MAG: hypothetical protein M1814_000627 [Vezdaea aestivalis]|nr:MAG: hypothetical protein M1814_000627 [Vezdaea aestivalis]
MGYSREQREGLLQGGPDDDNHELDNLPSPSDFEHHKNLTSHAFANVISRRKRWPFVVFAAFVALGFLYFLSNLYGHPIFRQKAADELSNSLVPGTNFTKPTDLKVIGLIFYGRRDRVSILDCYLRENLAENGGILDEIQFMTMTEVKEDVAWLDAAVAQTPGYRKIYNETKPKLEWNDGYGTLERGAMYVKIDDDVVYIDNTTIPRLVRTALQKPEYLIVAANAINSPLLSWVHYLMGAVKPFLPELHQPEGTAEVGAKVDWHTSGLPIWKGPLNYTVLRDTPKPYENHRWLPMESGKTTDLTPISRAQYDAFGQSWNEWGIAAQQHYSFFANAEEDASLEMYKFKIWETGYTRLSINLIVFRGEDILDNGLVPAQDEEYLTVELPKKLRRHVAVDGQAMAAHYSFGPQVAHEHGGWGKKDTGLGYTDIMERYRSFAEQTACKGPTRSYNTPIRGV